MPDLTKHHCLRQRRRDERVLEEILVDSDCPNNDDIGNFKTSTLHLDKSYSRSYLETTALPHDTQLPLDVIASTVSSTTATNLRFMDRVTQYVQDVK